MLKRYLAMVQVSWDTVASRQVMPQGISKPCPIHLAITALRPTRSDCDDPRCSQSSTRGEEYIGRYGGQTSGNATERAPEHLSMPNFRCIWSDMEVPDSLEVCSDECRGSDCYSGENSEQSMGPSNFLQYTHPLARPDLC